MGEYKVISRSALYDSGEESAEEAYLPNMEFEEVDMAKNSPKEAEKEAEEEEDEGFAFPLFGGDSVMTVTLKEEEEEQIVNERPTTYYRAEYSESEKSNFAAAAVSYDFILLHSQPGVDSHPWKVMSVEQHNQKVDHERQRSRKRREGKKKRENKVQCRERRQQREKEQRRLAKEALDRERKQRYGKYKKVGKVREKKPVEKPKYRTE